MKKARAARELKLTQRELVRQKVAQNLPITPEERALLSWKGGNRQRATEEEQAHAAAAKLVIKPQSVTNLRLLVETTAAKHCYNPIEELIKMTKPGAGQVELKEQVAIHKALLPFLVPQLATPKAGTGDGSGEGVKVVVTQFHFPPGHRTKDPSAPLHEERPVTAATTPHTS